MASPPALPLPSNIRLPQWSTRRPHSPRRAPPARALSPPPRGRAFLIRPESFEIFLPGTPFTVGPRWILKKDQCQGSSTSILNGSSSFGIHHFSALLKVDVCIFWNFGNSDNPMAGLENCFGKFMGSLIETAIETLPNSSPLLIPDGNVAFGNVDCEHFTNIIETDYGEDGGGGAGASHWHMRGNHGLMWSFGYTKSGNMDEKEGEGRKMPMVKKRKKKRTKKNKKVMYNDNDKCTPLVTTQDGRLGGCDEGQTD